MNHELVSARSPSSSYEVQTEINRTQAEDAEYLYLGLTQVQSRQRTYSFYFKSIPLHLRIFNPILSDNLHLGLQQNQSVGIWCNLQRTVPPVSEQVKEKTTLA